nr:SagB family peptide dehydrogenase [Methylocapsa palsarum]
MSARLCGHVTLEAGANGRIVATFGGYSVDLGTFGAGAADHLEKLGAGLPLSSFECDNRIVDEALHAFVRRLARHGLLEYRFGRSPDGDAQCVIEPQHADYWPGKPHLGDSDIIVLSRFAYMRRRGDAMVLESPRAGALFQICDPRIAAALVFLSTPQQLKQLRTQDGFLGVELLALLLDCQMLFKTASDGGLRVAEGDDNLVLWDFHDFLFHARSTEGRHANPLGGVYPYAGVIPPPPALRPRWPGTKIDLASDSAADPKAISALAQLLRERHSTRDFDPRRPIKLAELSRFLDGAARVISTWSSRVELGGGGPMVAYASRPYPSAGAAYPLELYLAVHECDGLTNGFYHYDAGGHALAAIAVRPQDLEALLTGAEFAMGARGKPQVLITIAARFSRISWKYSSIAYALILKDVGALLQTFYLMATDMGLGGCAVGSVNIELFAKMTRIEFHIEGSVGQFAIGREAKPDA